MDFSSLCVRASLFTYFVLFLSAPRLLENMLSEEKRITKKQKREREKSKEEEFGKSD